MFYLLATNKMIEVPAELVDANGNKSDPPLPFEKLRVLFQAEDIDTLRGYITLAQENIEHEIYQEVFLPIADDTGVMHEFYMVYEWLPTAMICRVEPPVEDIKTFVPTRPSIFNPACFEAIEKFRGLEQKQAEKEQRAQARAEKAAAPKAAKRGRPKKVVEPAE